MCIRQRPLMIVSCDFLQTSHSQWKASEKSQVPYGSQGSRVSSMEDRWGAPVSTPQWGEGAVARR